MSLELKQNNDFRNIIRFSKNISSEIGMFTDNDSVIMQTSDIFQKIFVDIYIKKSHFESFENFKNININSINLHQILLFANRFSNIKMNFNDKFMNINIQFNNVSKKFKFPYLNKIIERKNININYDHFFKIDTKEFYEIVKKCDEINNFIILEIKEGKISFFNSGDFASIKIDKTLQTVKDINLRMKFSTKSLLCLTKLYKISENLTIYFNEELPIKIVSDVGEIKVNAFLVQENM